MTISDDLPNRILLGRISVHNDVKQITRDGCVFVDGTEIKDIDAIIFGTGYIYSFPFLDKSVIRREGHFSYLYKLVWPAEMEHHTLAVVGLVQPFGPLPPVLEIQARWAAQVFAGGSKLPSNGEMIAAVEKWRDFVKKRYVDSPKYSTQIYFIQYIDEVARFIGCRPNTLKYFFTEPKLWYKIVVGPATPPQWRLDGPGQWAGARKALDTVEENTIFPMASRKSGSRETEGLYDGWIELFTKLSTGFVMLMIIKFILSNEYHTILLSGK